MRLLEQSNAHTDDAANRNIPVIVAAVLHDVIDDTDVPLSAIVAEFGEEVRESLSHWGTATPGHNST